VTINYNWNIASKMVGEGGFPCLRYEGYAPTGEEALLRLFPNADPNAFNYSKMSQSEIWWKQ
jgi:hypothetical protein